MEITLQSSKTETIGVDIGWFIWLNANMACGCGKRGAKAQQKTSKKPKYDVGSKRKKTFIYSGRIKKL